MRRLGSLNRYRREQLLLWLLVAVLSFYQTHAWSLFSRSNHKKNKKQYDYDLTIIGAGAAGLFASGAAQMFGGRTCMIEKSETIGGDCTNAACVPSKGLRSFAKTSMMSRTNDTNLVRECQEYVYDTVRAVRNRENPNDQGKRNPFLDLIQVQDCYFVNPHTLDVTTKNGTTTKTMTSRRFLIATGAGPVIPKHLQKAAHGAGLFLSTYQSILRPETNDPFWELFANASKVNKPSFRLLVAGGGATACELTQSLARLAAKSRLDNPFCKISIELVAPAILPNEDVTLQQAAIEILCSAGIQWHFGRLAHIFPDKSVLLTRDGGSSNNTTTTLPPVDALLLCLGRSPAISLESLRLENAGVEWGDAQGIQVHPHSLRSVSAHHVFASGDCCNAIAPRMRTASQAAWTGFHAVRNLKLPTFLLLGDRASVQRNLPRVIYTDPEMACVGLTYRECVNRFGVGGFDSMCAAEKGMDRADMERGERETGPCFVELRADQHSGRVLGLSACGPAAAELTNSMAIAITNGLTVADVAKSAHSYPSYGYLLYRVALSMALSNTWGVLEACGPIGKKVAKTSRFAVSIAFHCRTIVRRPQSRRHVRRLRQWQEEGASRALCFERKIAGGGSATTKPTCNFQVVSYLDVYQNSTLQKRVEDAASASNGTDTATVTQADAECYMSWYRNGP